MPKQVDYNPFEDEAPAPAARGAPVDHDPFADAEHSDGRYAELPFKKPGGTFLPSIPRQLGLTARHMVTGVTSIPTMIGDAANAALNIPMSLANKYGDTDFWYGQKHKLFQAPSDVTQDAMTAVGVPQPEGALERIVGVGSSAVGGAGAANVLSRMSAGLPAIPEILRTLSEGPKIQAAGALTGATAVEGAKELGVDNPVALMGLSVGAGMLPGGGATVATRGASGLRQAAAPFTMRGRERLVGEALNRVSSTPTATAERLMAAQEIVPGSRPMVPDVAQDPGLLGAHRAVRGMDERNLIGQRMSEQNAARQADLDRIAGDETTLQAALDKRGRTFQQMAEPAFENAGRVEIGREWINNPVLRRIQEIRETPEGARQTVREALDEVQAMITTEGADLGNPRVLYEIRKDLDLLRTGKLSGAGKSGRERANMGTAETQISNVIRALDDTIESAAPGYRDYMQMFAKRSVPVSQLRALQSLRERANLSAPDGTTQNEVISQGKFRALLRNNMVANPNYGGRGPGAARLRGNYLDQDGKRAPVLADLSPNHLRVLDRVAADLDRGAAPNSANVRSHGSDTFQNMSIAAVLGRVLGDRAGEVAAQSTTGKSITAPLNFLYRMPERDVQLLMIEAWRDPALAGRLMRDATRAEIEDVGRELARRAQQQAAANAMYGQGGQ